MSEAKLHIEMLWKTPGDNGAWAVAFQVDGSPEDLTYMMEAACDHHEVLRNIIISAAVAMMYSDKKISDFVIEKMNHVHAEK